MKNNVQFAKTCSRRMISLWSYLANILFTKTVYYHGLKLYATSFYHLILHNSMNLIFIPFSSFIQRNTCPCCRYQLKAAAEENMSDSDDGDYEMPDSGSDFSSDEDDNRYMHF
jgi:hypothetical protein